MTTNQQLETLTGDQLAAATGGYHDADGSSSSGGAIGGAAGLGTAPCSPPANPQPKPSPVWILI